MNTICPPPQVILVGFEPNQQGQAALQVQASSSWPTIRHGTAAVGALVSAFVVPTLKARQSPPSARTRQDRSNPLRFIVHPPDWISRRAEIISDGRRVAPTQLYRQAVWRSKSFPV